MLNKVRSAIEKHGLLVPGEPVIVGLSGGADSCALLLSLHKLGCNVTALHVNHGIRGEEALRDEDFARSLCASLSIPFFCEKADIPAIASEKKLSLETAARIERYKLFNAYSKKLSAKIAVAHNKNDQAETVLMHLLRGSSLNGLCGMRYKNGSIIRPLLDVTRDEIEHFCRQNGVDFVTDSTNLEPDASRNVIRLEILPSMISLYPDAVSSITSCAELLSEYDTLIADTVDPLFDSLVTVAEDKVTLKITDIKHILRCELIKKALLALNGDLVDIEAVHIESIASLWEKQSGKEIFLPFCIRAKRIYSTVEFTYADKAFSAEYEFLPEKTYHWANGNISSRFVQTRISGDGSEYLDFDRLPPHVTLRTRKSGDRIKKLNCDGSCTLKKYFIDKKIPESIRDSIPLLACGSDILAVIGYTVADSVKITENTKNIINIFQGEKL